MSMTEEGRRKRGGRRERGGGREKFEWNKENDREGEGTGEEGERRKEEKCET